MTRYSRRRLLFGLSLPSLLVIAAVAACRDRAGGQTRVEQPEKVVHRDPPRDSFVVDSLSRFVNTDSVYIVLRRMLTAQTPQREWQRALCLESHLMRQYGMLPADAALQRMNDTLWRGDEAQQVTRRLPAAGAINVSPDICGPLPPRAPARVDGVNLNGWEGPRPVPDPPSRSRPER